jgi:adenine phosphoribosyltransferase
VVPLADVETVRLPRLVESLRSAPVVDRAGYPYFVHPLTDGVPRLEPELLREAVEALAARLDPHTSLLVTPEAMGIHLTTALSLATGLPMSVVRKRSYGLEGETAQSQRTGYSEGTLYVNGVSADDRVSVIDDVASTGGTVRAVATALARRGARLLGVHVVVNKGLDLEALAAEVGAPVHALVEVRVRNGRVEVVSAST